MGFVYVLSVDDDDPLGSTDAMRNIPSLPAHYNKLGLYDFELSTTRTFVFIINDRSDSNRC